MSDKRLFFPSCARNRDPILAQLKHLVPPGSTLLEIGSGSGEHSVYMTPHLGDIYWQPSDIDPANLDSINAWRTKSDTESCTESYTRDGPEESTGPRVLAPLRVDASAPNWEKTLGTDTPLQPRPIRTIFSANVIHISPPSVTDGLLRGAAQLLPAGGKLLLYGPFLQNGAHTSLSNADFDAWLKAKDPSFGIKDISQLQTNAAPLGLALNAQIPMPANNFLMVFEKG